MRVQVVQPNEPQPTDRQDMANHEGIFTLKDLREAYDTLQDIKAKDPNDPTIFFYKAFSSQLAGRADVAKKHYESFRNKCVKVYGDVPAAISHFEIAVQSLESKGYTEKNKEVAFLKMIISKLETLPHERTYDTRAAKSKGSCAVA